MAQDRQTRATRITTGQDAELTLKQLYDEIQLPPHVRDMPLSKALFGQIGYWGVSRTLRAYERCVRDGVNLTMSMVEFKKAVVALEQQKTVLENIELVHDATIEELQAKLARHRAERAIAEKIEEQAKLEREEMIIAADIRRRQLEAQSDMTEEHEEIARNKVRAELLRSRERLDELEPKPDVPFAKKWDERKEKVKQIEKIEKDIAKMCRAYGGEKKIPDSLRQAIELMREEMMVDLGAVD